ncbi:hypothetical protein [Pseudochrobactrum sp. HB0163]|uniref:hypothetical protein n=1 Tax=Pseudochrobactrum sp. HB0163 TaxID=3450708 RepID=UPI003F6E277B
MEDLNGFLGEIETLGATNDHPLIAKTCRDMSIDASRDIVRQLYNTDRSMTGIFLMRCMRINNLSTHDEKALQAFKHLFDDLGIKIEGNWGQCVQAVSFNCTSFVDGRIIVQL